MFFTNCKWLEALFLRPSSLPPPLFFLPGGGGEDGWGGGGGGGVILASLVCRAIRLFETSTGVGIGLGRL